MKINKNTIIVIIVLLLLGLCSCSSSKQIDSSILIDYLYFKIYSQNNSKENLIKSIIKRPEILKQTIENNVFYNSLYVSDDFKDTLHTNKIATLLLPYKQLSTFQVCDYSFDAESKNEISRYFYHSVAVMLENKKCIELTFKLINKKWYFYNINFLSKDETDWFFYEDCFKEKK